MKLSKKLLYSAVVLATVAGPTVGPVAQFAISRSVNAEEIILSENTQTVLEGRLSTQEPAQTKVNIHKLVASQYNAGVPVKNTNGLPLSPESLQKLGDDVKGLNDVEFEVYHVLGDSQWSDEQLSKLTKKEIETAVSEKKLELMTQTYTTSNQDGVDGVAKALLSKGQYLFVEKKAPATVSSALAVPFALTLPAHTADGNKYLNEIDVYPKNVQGETPKSGKDVKALGNNILPVQIGQPMEFYLKGTIPTNIADYSEYYFTDELDSQLSLLTAEQDFEVVFGKTGKLEFNKDFKVELTAEKTKIKVSLTADGIKKIAAETTFEQRKASMTLNSGQGENGIQDIKENTNEKPFIQVKFSAKLNKTAKIGKAVKNDTTITFNNRPNKGDNLTPNTPPTPSKSEPSDKTVVVTSGKRFVKVETGNSENHLSGAEFEIYVKGGRTPLTWTADLIAANRATNDKFGGEIADGKPIVLKSSSLEKGRFEFVGLPLGTVREETSVEGLVKRTVVLADGVSGVVDDVNIDNAVAQLKATYELKETKAPSGYVINDNRIPFELTPQSYYSNPTEVEFGSLKAAEPQEISNNKRPSIPNTGGIGTAIFVAIGAAVMAFAAKGMKRRTEEN